LLACLAGAWLFAASLHAQAPAGAVKVVGVLGSANFSVGNQPFQPVESGVTIPEGAVLRTGPRSAVDLDFGRLVGTVRLTQNTTLNFDRVANTGQGQEAQLDVELTLSDGALLGNTGKLPASAKFQVKVLNGIAGVDSGQFRLQAQGYVVLLSGTVIFVHIPGGGAEPAPYTMRAPPAIYFSPIEQIRPAPQVLVREVQNQTRSKLPR
jgi:hypothetical protein